MLLRLFSMLVITFLTTHVYALTISYVIHTPSMVKAGDDRIAVRFKLDEPAEMVLNIYNKYDRLIKQVRSDGQLPAGESQLVWQLDDIAGNAALDEAYHYTLVASNGEQSVVYDMTELSGNKRLAPKNLKWDKNNKAIHYLLAKPARVRIRAGIPNGGPLLRNLVDWAPRSYGQNIENWDGYDTNKQLDIAQLDATEIYVEAYTFSQNTIVVNRGNTQNTNTATPPAIQTGQAKFRTSSKSRKFQSLLAEQQPDYQLGIALSGDKVDATTQPVTVKDKVRISLDVAENEVTRMVRDRFEPTLFINHQYYSSIESGFLPISWTLNVDELPAGIHTITANVRGYYGQFGMATRKIRVVK